jgi:hypothetical protein
VLLAVVGIDVHAADHVAGRRIEDGVGKACAVLEVVGVRLQVARRLSTTLRSSGQELVSQPGVVWMCSTDDDHAS